MPFYPVVPSEVPLPESWFAELEKREFRDAELDKALGAAERLARHSDPRVRDQHDRLRAWFGTGGKVSP